MLQRKWHACIILLIFMFFDASDAYLGISINSDTSNLESVAEIISSLQSHKISHVRLINADHRILKALSGTDIGVIVSIPNYELQGIGESKNKAAEWINTNIKPFVPATNIECIAVGDEVLSMVPDMAPILVQTMEYIHLALLNADLSQRIKISSPQSAKMIPEPLPPSSASFDSNFISIMYHFLEFLKYTGSPLMINAHPNINDLFQPVPSSEQTIDPKTHLRYSSMFDAVVDAAYYSMEALGYSEIPVLVTESARQQDSVIDSQLVYNIDIMHMVSNSGTPSRPSVSVNIYIDQLFNEEPQYGLVTSRMLYSLDLQSVSHDGTEAAGVSSFCVALMNADSNALLAALNWACGPGGANCSAIQQGQPCYSTNLVADASYAFNDYYQKNKATGGTCSFNSTAALTPTDPSNGLCIFTGSSGTGTNTGSGGTNTNSSTGGSGSIIPSPPSFGPSSFINSVSKLQLNKLSYLVAPVILFSWFKTVL